MVKSEETAVEAKRQTRNTKRTRRAVLDAAAALIAETGPAVTITKVAAHAEVSKSGLLHHFSNRDELVAAVLQDSNQQFRDLVRTHLDLSENHPGKMLRAYVRTLCGESAAARRYFTSSPMWNGVQAIPSVLEVVETEARWWSEQFALDGLSPRRILLVQRAAEGAAAAVVYGEGTDEDLAQALPLLLQLATEGTFVDPL